MGITPNIASETRQSLVSTTPTATTALTTDGRRASASSVSSRVVPSIARFARPVSVPTCWWASSEVAVHHPVVDGLPVVALEAGCHRLRERAAADRERLLHEHHQREPKIAGSVPAQPHRPSGGETGG